MPWKRIGCRLARGSAQSYQIEERYVRKMGRSAGLPRFGELLFGSTGDVHAIGMVEDITARKSAEEALRLSEERLKLALEASTDGLWDLEPGDARDLL